MSDQLEPDKDCFWGWIAIQDPALSAYVNRAEHTAVERRAFLMGMAAGRLDAAHELLDYHDEDGVTDLAHALDTYLFVQKALLRRRDSIQFVRSLREHLSADGGDDDRP